MTPDHTDRSEGEAQGAGQVPSDSPAMPRDWAAALEQLGHLRAQRDIQHVLYINLDKRTDRREHIESELASMGFCQHDITRVEAIDARSNGETPANCCARSHVLAIETAIAAGWDTVLIVEDDFMLLESARATWRRWAQFLWHVPTYDIASWSHNCLWASDWPAGGVARVRYLQTASAYVVRKAAMTKLRDIIHEAIAINRPFDRHMTLIANELGWYALKPPLGQQMPSYSDIELRYVNYGC